ncbi:Long-chain-fatty-acid-CoA ligase 1 [Smittium culicis]|uniref:Long-chain-fatty-acid-CoA ligase 1 n=1 Tax=Smittium culicis TaxID=133412 RepID=A0A1R1YFY6_9FUNG|nr:Long-chain-fatty-acid-CoA ligase 1 [Smittium culicis]
MPDFFLIFFTLFVVVLSIIYLGFFMSRNKKPDTHPLITREQSNVSKVRRNSTESLIYRNRIVNLNDTLASSFDQNVTSLSDLVSRSFDLNSLNFKLSETDKKLSDPKTSSDILADSKNLYSSLLNIKNISKFSSQITIAILLEPSYEWFISYITSIHYGFIFIPLQHSETETEIFLTLDHSKVNTIITNHSWAKKLSKYSSPLNIIVAGESDTPLAIHKSHFTTTFNDLVSPKNSTNLDHVSPPKISPNQIAYVLYERDINNNLVGNVISHSNSLSIVSSYHSILPKNTKITSKDTFFLAESLADPSAINLLNLAILFGSSISVSQSDDSEITINQMYLYTPSIIYLPPLLLRDLASLMRSNIYRMPTVEVKLFEMGYSFVSHCINNRGFIPGFSFWDFAYFLHYRRTIGNNTKLIYTTGNDQPSTISFLRTLFGCQIFSTGGPSSVAGALCCNIYGDYQQEKYPGIGPPLPCCEIKLVEHDDSSLKLSPIDTPNPRGLIYVRGNSVSKFFWNPSTPDSPTIPSPNLSNDGWLNLNSYGQFLPNRTLQLLSRSFINNVPTSTIQQLCLKSKYVADAHVYLNPSSSKNLSIVVHPRSQALYDSCKSSKMPYMLKSVAKNKFAISLVHDDLWRIFVKNKINFFLLDSEKSPPNNTESNKSSFELVLTPERFKRSNEWINSSGLSK